MGMCGQDLFGFPVGFTFKRERASKMTRRVVKPGLTTRAPDWVSPMAAQGGASVQKGATLFNASQMVMIDNYVSSF